MKVGECYIQHQRIRAAQRTERRERAALLLAVAVGIAACWYLAGWALDHPVNNHPPPGAASTQ